MAVTAVSTVAVDGGVTLGVSGRDGDVVMTWLGAARFPTPVRTPYGDLWVPFDLVLPSTAIVADDRVYTGLSMPNIPALRGATLHAQAATVARSSLRLTNPASVLLH